jgi:putative flippase GtrA
MPVTVESSAKAPQNLRALTARSFLIEPTNDALVQFVRYTIAGSAALVVDFCVLFLLTRFGAVYYLLSAAVGFVVGLSINYGLSTAWVFGHRKLHNHTAEFVIFTVIGIAGLGLNELGMWLLTSKAHAYYLVAKLFTAAAVYIWNFGIRKVILFR